MGVIHRLLYVEIAVYWNKAIMINHSTRECDKKSLVN